MKKILAGLLSIIIAFSVCSASVFAEGQDCIGSAEYFSEDYLYIKVNPGISVNESAAEIELTYESGRKVMSASATDITALKENEYYAVPAPEQGATGAGILLLADSAFSDDRITEIHFGKGTFVINGNEYSEEQTSTVNEKISDIYRIITYSRYDHNGKPKKDTGNLYCGCSTLFEAKIPNGLDRTFSFQITTPAGETLEIINGTSSLSSFYKYSEPGTYSFSALCNGSVCWQSEINIITKEEAKKEKLLRVADDILRTPIYGVEAILLSPVLLLLSFNPLFFALSGGGVIAVPFTLLASALSSISEFFNILFKF